jgi:hypothetical protein
MEKELNHQGKEIRGERDVTTPESKRDTRDSSQPETSTIARPRRRIRAYQRIDYWQ